MGTKYKAARARIIGILREKVINLNEAVDMLRASEVAAQHIKEIDQGTSEKWFTLHCPLRNHILVNNFSKVHGPEACCYI